MSVTGKKVFVQDGNIDKALRKFKKKVNDSGILQEVQLRQSYTKPAIKRKVAKNQAKKRWQRYLQSQVLPDKPY